MGFQRMLHAQCRYGYENAKNATIVDIGKDSLVVGYTDYCDTCTVFAHIITSIITSIIANNDDQKIPLN